MCKHGGTDNRDLLGMLDAAAEMLRAAGRFPLGGGVPDVALTQAVQKLEALARIAQGQKLSVVSEISQREAHRGHAAASTPDLLARVLHLAPGEARAQAELAAGLALVPDTAAALRDGRIGIGQAAVTVKKAEEVKDRDDADELLAKIDATASTAGQTLDRNRLAREIDTTVARSGVDVLAERERSAHARRRLDITTRDGMTVIHAELDPYAGAQVRAALDALSKKNGDGDTRPFPQRQADALAHMATLAEGNEGKPQGTLQSARVLLVTSGVRAGAGTARRLSRGPALAWGSGTLSSPWAAPVAVPSHRRHPPARNADTDVSGVRRGNRPRVLAMRQRHAPTAAGHTRIRTRGLGRSRGPDYRDGTPRGWNCHHHIHQQGWEVTKDATGRYRAGPPHLVPPHLENSIAIHTHAHTG